MNPHQIHARNCGIVKTALENAGYKCAQPSADVKSVDIVATPIDGGPALNVQVRSRLSFFKKYCGKNIHIAFPDQTASGALVRLYHLDEMLAEASRLEKVTHAVAWKRDGTYHVCPTPHWALQSPILHSLPGHPIKFPMDAPVANHPAKIRRTAPAATALTKKEVVNTVFLRAAYEDMNARQQENYNFHKIAAVMAEYGYNSIRLSDDWEYADFIAIHIDGDTMRRVQLKGRFGFDKKYRGKNLWIAFRDSKSEEIYVYPHDKLLSHYITRFEGTVAWQKNGNYHFPSRTFADKKLLAPYRLTLRT